MRQVVMFRQQFERAALTQERNIVAFVGQLWQNVREGHEVLATEEEARERYDEMKMILVTDYGFHPFFENIDD